MPAAPVHICRRSGFKRWTRRKNRNAQRNIRRCTPDFLPVFKEDKPLAVTDAVSAGKPLIVAVAIVQREGRMRHNPVVAAR